MFWLHLDFSICEEKDEEEDRAQVVGRPVGLSCRQAAVLLLSSCPPHRAPQPPMSCTSSTWLLVSIVGFPLILFAAPPPQITPPSALSRSSQFKPLKFSSSVMLHGEGWGGSVFSVESWGSQIWIFMRPRLSAEPGLWFVWSSVSFYRSLRGCE